MLTRKQAFGDRDPIFDPVHVVRLKGPAKLTHIAIEMEASELGAAQPGDLLEIGSHGYIITSRYSHPAREAKVTVTLVPVAD